MRKTIISSLAFLSLFAEETTPQKQEEPKCPQGVTSILDLRHRESGGVGYSQGYTSLDYFLTAQGDNWEVLFNLRGHLFNDDQAAGNAGIGMRFPIYDEKYLIGANVFYDFRQSSHLFANQVGAGVEWLGKYVDFRVNGYGPVGKVRNVEKRRFGSFTGNNLSIRQRLKGTLPSIEGEVGTPLPKHFYFAAGTYYLFGQEKDGIHLGNAWGAKLRGEVNFGRYFTLGAVATYDHIFHTRFQGVLSLNIPLGKWKSTNKVERCLRQVPIMRNEIIPIQTKAKTKFLAAVEGNDPIRFVFVNNMAPFPGDGSIEHPFASLKEAETYSKPGDIIYVFPGDGTSKNMDEGIVLKDNQVLVSSGASAEVEGVIIPAQTPGEMPTITNMHSDEPVVTNPGETDLSNFRIVPWDFIFGTGGSRDPTPNSELDYDDGHPTALPHEILEFHMVDNPAADSASHGNPGGAVIIDDYVPPPAPPPPPGNDADLDDFVHVEGGNDGAQAGGGEGWLGQ